MDAVLIQDEIYRRNIINTVDRKAPHEKETRLDTLRNNTEPNLSLNHITDSQGKIKMEGISLHICYFRFTQNKVRSDKDT